MDQHLQFETRSATIKMTVTDGMRTREHQMITFGRGESDSAMEYQAPEREKGTRIPTKQELYAQSGMLLKTWTMGDVQDIGGQMTPMRMEIKDNLRAGSSTVIVTSELKYGIDLEDEVFSKRWLERAQ